ncbi:MAG TPA: rRNA maturation RNase YbeY [Vicinamibacterales bacterium]|nr:rRNA maturation RNase YbeY [Vicinamibacterales bacterium]
MPEGDTRLRIVVSDESGRRASAPGLAAWLRRVAPRRARGAVTIALVSDRRIRALNRTYRRKDYATDVLSFPNQPSSINQSNQLNQQSAISTQQFFLGDIVIARGVARRQAREAGHSERTELKVLALHGLLHLLGYDHERDDGRMRRVERRLRRQGGLRESLTERGARARR